mgnify:CR=1 FL=1
MSPDRRQPDRRQFAFTVAAGLTAASLAACHKSILSFGRFDPKVMDKGFPPLAGRARPWTAFTGARDSLVGSVMVVAQGPYS